MNVCKSSHRVSHPGHLHTPWPYKWWTLSGVVVLSCFASSEGVSSLLGIIPSSVGGLSNDKPIAHIFIFCLRYFIHGFWIHRIGRLWTCRVFFMFRFYVVLLNKFWKDIRQPRLGCVFWCLEISITHLNKYVYIGMCVLLLFPYTEYCQVFWLLLAHIFEDFRWLSVITSHNIWFSAKKTVVLLFERVE